jgi:hypothetical protein
MMQQDMINKGLNLTGMAHIGITKVGQVAKWPFAPTLKSRPINALGQEIPPTKYELAQEQARINANKMLGLPENNTYLDRAKVYNTPAYHGTRSDVKALDPSKAQFAREGSGTWLSENPHIANTYAGKMDGNVMPLLVKTKKYGEIDALKQNWNKIPADSPIRHSNQTDSAMNEYIDRFDDIGDTN